MDLSERVLVFGDNVHEALWGRERWLTSAHPAGESVVAGGKFAGRKLSEIVPGFPLLVKEIDAKTRLSVQVHPNEATAPATGGSPKTEMWCMLDDGFVYAGLKEGVSPGDVERAVADGSFENLLVRHDLKAGDCVFIPGGLVHAIGDSTRLYEVQQSSDTTFRLYDWNRVGADGKKRELHVEKALAAIDYSLPTPVPSSAVKCPFFDFRRVAVKGAAAFPGDGFAVLRAFRGGFRLAGLDFPEGADVLVLGGGPFEVESPGCEILATTKN